MSDERENLAEAEKPALITVFDPGPYVMTPEEAEKLFDTDETGRRGAERDEALDLLRELVGLYEDFGPIGDLICRARALVERTSKGGET